MRSAECAGSCRPVEPGGVGTYGIAVRAGDTILLRRSGRVPDSADMTAELAEAFGLVVLLDWMQANPGPVVIDCASKAVVENARREREATEPAMRLLQDKARAGLPVDARLRHMGRTRVPEADALSRLAYVEAMEADPRLQELFEAQLASPHQLERARKAGAPVHAYMGAEEAERLSRRAKSR